MNKQEKYRNGILVGRGIQWTDYTINPIGGCKHACRWVMPDGSTAICYAEEVANGVAQRAYPHGFAHHYHHLDKMQAVLTVRDRKKFFIDSMSDLLGRWVPANDIQTVLDMCARVPRHIFQVLTKNAPRITQFDFPANIWIGASSPPDMMLGHTLTHEQQRKMLERTLATLGQIKDRVTWMSFEPLSWDVADIVARYPGALRWAVIGAATNGPTVYQPSEEAVNNLLAVLDAQHVPVFFKGNLEGNAAATPWREYFPGYVKSTWMDLINAGRLSAHTPARTPVHVRELEQT